MTASSTSGKAEARPVEQVRTLIITVVQSKKWIAAGTSASYTAVTDRATNSVIAMNRSFLS